MSRRTHDTKRLLFRTWLIIAAGLVIGGIALCVYEYFGYFRHTSYIFVGLFLLVIILSNILARLARAFITA